MPFTQPPPNANITLDVDQIMSLFVQKRYDEISQKFLPVLEYFRDNTMFVLTPEVQYFLDQFVKVFLFVLSEPAFVISDRFAIGYLSFNHVISNIVSMSSMKTTDAHVEILARQPDNLLKLLTLLSARNKFQIDRKLIFDTNPAVASVWFSFYACSYYSALVSKAGWDNLREHFSYSDPRLRINHQIQETYFGSTYAGGDRDSLIKPIVNLTTRENNAAVTIQRKEPNPRKIAVISAFWALNTSVFRILSGYVRSLKPDFHLTFIQISNNAPPEAGLWDEVIQLTSPQGGLDISKLQNNDFQIIYFPDIGMSDGSILLANLRLAPIQICGLGHSASTFGAQIDYFISGVDVERPENPEGNYSERLVLLPGMGAIHNRPNYERRGLKKQTTECLVNVPAWCQKLNYEYIQTLKKLIGMAKTKFKLRVFTGNSLLRANDYVPFHREILAQLGPDYVEIAPSLPYPDYMANMEQGDLTIDAYHFGGCNTVSDSLFVGVPMLCWEGEKWYNRIGPDMLRRCGLPELIATNEAEYLERAVRLIDDEPYREGLRRRISDLNLSDAIYSTQDAKYFNSAMHYLIDNHERLGKESLREAIRIPRE